MNGSDVFEKNLVQKLGQNSLNRIREAKIGIAGAGGLGSNCATNLVRSGFRKFVIVDFDVVSIANLDRQAYFFNQVGMKKVEALKDNLLKISSCLEIRAVDMKLNHANIQQTFSECDVIIECFDRADAKSMFVEELLPFGRFLVTASGH